MTVLLAVMVVGLGSLAFLRLPMLSTGRRPEKLTQGAGWAGLAVIAGISVRSVLLTRTHPVPVVPLPPPWRSRSGSSWRSADGRCWSR